MDRFKSKEDTVKEKIRELEAEEMIQNKAQRYKEKENKEKRLSMENTVRTANIHLIRMIMQEKERMVGQRPYLMRSFRMNKRQ